ncbi:MAG: potassium channel family protein [Bacteroidia bacterium]
MAVVFLLLNLLIGVLGFIKIEGYSLLNAVYMTVISMSTVGYGIAERSDFSANGKVFIIFLLIINAGTFVFAVTTITSFVVEGELRTIVNRWRFQRMISKLKDHVIICGLGRTGRECAAELLRQGANFIVIEQNEEVLHEFGSHHNSLNILGDATIEETLIKANIHTAKGLISALPNDAENVFITLTARSLNPKLELVGRAEHDYNISKLKRAGADHVILPNQIGGRRMVNLITRPGLIEFIELISGETETDVHIETCFCSDYPFLLNKSLAELDIRAKTGLLVIGCKHQEENTDLNPDPSMMIVTGDRLFLLGNKKHFDLFRSLYLENSEE